MTLAERLLRDIREMTDDLEIIGKINTYFLGVKPSNVKLLSKWFSVSELRTMAFEFGIRYDYLTTPDEISQVILSHVNREYLEACLIRQRPHVDWSEL